MFNLNNIKMKTEVLEQAKSLDYSIKQIEVYKNDFNRFLKKINNKQVISFETAGLMFSVNLDDVNIRASFQRCIEKLHFELCLTQNHYKGLLEEL